MRTFRTSAGFPAMPPRKPDIEAMETRVRKEGDFAVVEEDASFSFNSS